MSKPNLIYLKKSDFEVVKQLNKKRKEGCSPSHLKKSFDKHLSDKIKYNKKIGIVSNRLGFISSYSYKKDIPKNPTRDEIIEWEFMGEITNSCSRLRRGFNP